MHRGMGGRKGMFEASELHSLIPQSYRLTVPPLPADGMPVMPSSFEIGKADATV